MTNDDPYSRFTARCRTSLRRIANATRGEHQPEDVAAEAWLMARDATLPNGAAFDFDADGADRFILARLYQHLVRYTDLNVRHAVRLDHAAAGASSDDVHPLMRSLASNEGRGPLEELERREAAIDEESALDESGSLAVAYVRLLRHFGNRMQAVADHLLISESWAYQRCARARLGAELQRSMTTPMMQITFMPGPWRPFQLRRIPLQLAFDFDYETSMAE